MGNFEMAKDFRRAAQLSGLIPDKDSPPQQAHFIFDLRYGLLFSTSQDPEKILRLVLEARTAADYESYGEHNTLLYLVTDVSDFWNHSVYWRSPYHTDAHVNPGKWVS